MKAVKFLITLLVVIILVSCSTNESSTNENNNVSTFEAVITGVVTDAFSGNPIKGISVTLLSKSGEELTVATNSQGKYEITINEAGEFLLLFNFKDINENYIPSIISKNGLTNNSGFISIDSDSTFDIDLIKVSDLFPQEIVELFDSFDECAAEFISLFRNVDKNGLNQRWVEQPEQWILYDPNGELNAFGGMFKDRILSAVVEGFQYIEEYTNGQIKAPEKDDIKIITSNEDPPQNSISFKLIDNFKSFYDVNNRDEIIRSSAQGSWKDLKKLSENMLSSIQGGKHKVNMLKDMTIFSGAGDLTQIDKKWGKLNYSLREPGSRMVGKLLYDEVKGCIENSNNEYGFLYEIRDLEEIESLAGN